MCVKIFILIQPYILKPSQKRFPTSWLMIWQVENFQTIKKRCHYQSISIYEFSRSTMKNAVVKDFRSQKYINQYIVDIESCGATCALYKIKLIDWMKLSRLWSSICIQIECLLLSLLREFAWGVIENPHAPKPFLSREPFSHGISKLRIQTEDSQGQPGAPMAPILLFLQILQYMRILWYLPR